MVVVVVLEVVVVEVVVELVVLVVVVDPLPVLVVVDEAAVEVLEEVVEVVVSSDVPDDPQPLLTNNKQPTANNENIANTFIPTPKISRSLPPYQIGAGGLLRLALKTKILVWEFIFIVSPTI